MKKLSNDEFIAKARMVHGEKYNYDGIVYLTNRSNVKIHCPSHGIFLQTPYKQLKSLGYNIKYIWEKDWKDWNKSLRNISIPIHEYYPI